MTDSIINNRMELDYVTKRDGTKEEIQFDKILSRIKKIIRNINL